MPINELDVNLLTFFLVDLGRALFLCMITRFLNESFNQSENCCLFVCLPDFLIVCSFPPSLPLPCPSLQRLLEEIERLILDAKLASVGRSELVRV